MTAQIAVRLPEELLDGIDRLVPLQFGSRSEVVRRALEEYLYRVACDSDAATYQRMPLTDAELLLADDPGAWEPTPQW